jgi:PKD repeat protein
VNVRKYYITIYFFRLKQTEDGTYSTKKNPMHKYKKPGKYTVSLTTKNAKGSNTKTMPGFAI